MDALLLALIQFGFTISFHIVVPGLTIGLASYLAVLESLWLHTGRQVYMDLYHFWSKVFAVVSALTRTRSAAAFSYEVADLAPDILR